MSMSCRETLSNSNYDKLMTFLLPSLYYQWVDEESMLNQINGLNPSSDTSTVLQYIFMPVG